MITPLFVNTRGSTRADKWQFLIILNYTWFLSKLYFCTTTVSLNFLSFTDDHRATPVQDMAQRRHRHRRAAGTRSKVSFQIKTLHKPCLLSLVVHILRILNTTEKDAEVIGISPCQNIACTWTLGVYY